MFSIELKYALQIVSELERTRLAGERVTTPDLRRRCGYEIPTFNNVMFYLNRSKWVDNELYHNLLVDLDEKNLLDLAEAIGDSAASDTDYIYGWSAGSLHDESVAVDISRSLCEEYRNRLHSMPLTALIGATGEVKKRRTRKSIKENIKEQKRSALNG